jgi:hypothetical protein
MLPLTMHLSRTCIGLVFLLVLLFCLILLGIFTLVEAPAFFLFWLLLRIVIAANTGGILAIGLAFTKYRCSAISFACGAASFDLGLLLTVFFLTARMGELTWPLQIVSWPALLLGGVGLLRWMQEPETKEELHTHEG